MVGQRAFRLLLVAALATISACGDSSPTSPPPPTPIVIDPYGVPPGVFPGFDTSLYPGDATMRAWVYPSSPYRWAGYYLAAPCHRDTSWTGKRSALVSLGWGITAIYVGQQDWTQIPSAAANRAVDPQSAAALAVCSASLLSASQGASEAADAVAKMAADGFPNQNIIFLDVEYVTTVTQPLLDYYGAWIRGVLADGRYQPGVYASKSNASALYNAAAAAYRAAGKSGAPAFWIAGGTGFSMSAKPTDVGFDFANLWQGAFDATQTWNGMSMTIDVDVASARSPSGT